MNWQPIETAPKDGTPVLIKSYNQVSIAVYNAEIFCNWQCCYLAQLWSAGWEGHKTDHALPLPTHWMPLPKVATKNRDYENLWVLLRDIRISTRLNNCFKNEGFKTLADVANKTDAELLRIPNFGKKSLKETQELLSEFGLTLMPKPNSKTAMKNTK